MEQEKGGREGGDGIASHRPTRRACAGCAAAKMVVTGKGRARDSRNKTARLQEKQHDCHISVSWVARGEGNGG